MAGTTQGKPSVYLETTVISYLTAWPTKEVVRQAQQEVTREWWRERRKDFSLFTSQFVINEASVGDSKAAAERLKVLQGIALVEISEDVEPLAKKLLEQGALPHKARVDALHVAVASVNEIQYLVTWNCKHLANVFLWDKIEQTCRIAGYRPPTILTPYELLGG
jgi:hypothetical protein